MFTVEFKSTAITMVCGLILGYAVGSANPSDFNKPVEAKPVMAMVDIEDRLYNMQSVKYNCASGVFWANRFSYNDNSPARLITVPMTGEFYAPAEFLEKNGPCIPIEVRRRITLRGGIDYEVAGWAKKVNTPVSKG